MKTRVLFLGSAPMFLMASLLQAHSFYGNLIGQPFTLLPVRVPALSGLCAGFEVQHHGVAGMGALPLPLATKLGVVYSWDSQQPLQGFASWSPFRRLNVMGLVNSSRQVSGYGQLGVWQSQLKGFHIGLTAQWGAQAWDFREAWESASVQGLAQSVLERLRIQVKVGWVRLGLGFQGPELWGDVQFGVEGFGAGEACPVFEALRILEPRLPALPEISSNLENQQGKPMQKETQIPSLSENSHLLDLSKISTTDSVNCPSNFQNPGNKAFRKDKFRESEKDLLLKIPEELNSRVWSNRAFTTLSSTSLNDLAEISVSLASLDVSNLLNGKEETSMQLTLKLKKNFMKNFKSYYPLADPNNVPNHHNGSDRANLFYKSLAWFEEDARVSGYLKFFLYDAKTSVYLSALKLSEEQRHWMEKALEKTGKLELIQKELNRVRIDPSCLHDFLLYACATQRFLTYFQQPERQDYFKNYFSKKNRGIGNIIDFSFSSKNLIDKKGYILPDKIFT